MAGRRPKPTARKEIEGNPGHRPLNKKEPRPGGIPECPDQLDAEAKQEWARVSAELIACGLLTSVDRAALEAYCEAYSDKVEAREHLKAFGKIIKSPSGYPIQNPYVALYKQAVDRMHKFMVEFGMTPSSRSRVASGEGSNPNAGARGQTQDPADKYFSGPAPIAKGSDRIQ